MNLAYAGYLDRLAASTRRVAASDLKMVALVAWPTGVDPAPDAPWHLLTNDQASAVRAHLAAHRPPGTANRMLAGLRGVIHAAWRAGMISLELDNRLRATLADVRGARVTRGRSLDWPAVERLRAAAITPDEHALVAVLVGAGLRVAEALSLTWERVTWRKGGVCMLRVLGKGNKERLVRLPAWASPMLLAACSRDPAYRRGPVFHWSERTLRDVVYALGYRAGLGHLSPHDLRRTYFDLCRRSGLDLATIRRSMGHASITTTVKYDRRSDDDVQAEMAALDDPGAVDTRRPVGHGR